MATPWEADRHERVKDFILPRKFLDITFNSPILRKLESKILGSRYGDIVSLQQNSKKLTLKRRNTMIISDLNYLESAESSAIVGGIYLGSGKFNKSTSLYVKEVVDIYKDVDVKVDIKGNVATAEAEAYGWDTMTQTFTFTTPLSS
ncbi:hypothetical protein, partial [Planktothrix sp.]|uniref:hypothetical protein n=1 Tax=Planktothrix sp. TaxID=3088171 RepID=UPI0038D4BDC6